MVVKLAETNPKVVEELMRAWANEWIAFYYYLVMISVVRFKGYIVFAEKLDQVAKEELEHAEELEERLVQLGESPIKDWTAIEKIANCPKVYYPDTLEDIKGILQALEEAETCVINVYERLLILTHDKDKATYHLISHIKSEEEEHRTIFEDLRKQLSL